MCFADIVIFSIKEIPNNITKLANIARICRFCYALSGFYNYSPSANCTTIWYITELWTSPAHLSVLFSFAKLQRRENVKYRFTNRLGGVDNSFPQFPTGRNWVFHQLLCHLLALSLFSRSLFVARKIQIPTRKPIKASKWGKRKTRVKRL